MRVHDNNRLRWVRRFACAMALLGAEACSGADGADAESGGAVRETCPPSPDYSPYQPGMLAESTFAFQLRLEAAVPAPPALGPNEWLISVMDEHADPFVDGTVAAVVEGAADDAGHVSALPTEVPGRYTLAGLQFTSAGVWRVTVQLFDALGGNLEQARFVTCIPDE